MRPQYRTAGKPQRSTALVGLAQGSSTWRNLKCIGYPYTLACAHDVNDVKTRRTTCRTILGHVTDFLFVLTKSLIFRAIYCGACGPTFLFFFAATLITVQKMASAIEAERLEHPPSYSNRTSWFGRLVSEWASIKHLAVYYLSNSTGNIRSIT